MSSESNELIIGANIVFPEINSGAITNSYGFFSITIPEGVYKVEISSIGFKNISKKIFLQKDLKVNYYLEENIENLNEVVVTKNVEEIDIKKPIMSLNILSNKTIKQTPVLFVESDLLAKSKVFLSVLKIKYHALKMDAVTVLPICLDASTMLNLSF